MTAPRTFRVFISSPSDVFAERERVERVIQRLNGELGGGALLEAVRWERSYYSAAKTFQDQIPLPSQTDLVICILWKRLGFELPPEYRRPDGTTPTGTEYEFEEAIEAARAHGTPDVLVYRKSAPVLLDAEQVDLERAQLDALKSFWARWFRTETGHFTAAYQSFETTDQFETEVEGHIRQWLARNRALLGGGATWPIALKGSPFRGLQPFDEGHAAVFFGRRRVVEQARERLAIAAARGTPFLLLLGTSGSGKSSVARAGLVPRLTQPGAVPGIDLWRRCVVRPSEGGGDPLLGLARALYRADVLPELGGGDSPAPADFSLLLATAPDAAARAVRLALQRAAQPVAAREGFDRPVQARLLLVVDQVEEALGGGAEERDRFGRALAALAAAGGTWIVATLRSDLYALFQASPPLAALRDGGAQFDLLPPAPAEIAEIITGPAQAAGLRYDARPGGASLDEELAEAAAAPGSLPLLQFALDELFQARDPQTGTLSVAAYDAFGGLAGVVERRAEAVLAGLDPAAAAALPGVLAALVNVSGDGVVTSRACLRAEAAATADAGRLVDAFVAARLLAAEERQGKVWLRVAHEALIAGWPRAQALIAADRDALRVRGRVEEAARRWTQEARHPDFLLPAGRPLAEAAELAEHRPAQLSTEMAACVAESQTAEAARQAAERERAERQLRLEADAAHARAEAATKVARRTRAAALVVSALLLVAAGAAVTAFMERREARRQAGEAERNFAAALTGATSLVRTVNDHLRDGVMTKQAARILLDTAESNLGSLAGTTAGTRPPPELQDARSKLQSSFAGVLLALGDSAGSLARARAAESIARQAAIQSPSDARRRGLSVTQNEVGDALDAAGDRPGALASYRASAATMESLVAREPGNAGWQRDLKISRDRVANTLRLQGDTAGALAIYKDGLTLDERQAAAHPEDAGAQRDLAISLEHVGDMLDRRGDPAGAAAAYEREAKMVQDLARREPENLDWQRMLSLSEDRTARRLSARGDGRGALEHYQAGQAIAERLAANDPGNTQWQRDLAVGDLRIGTTLVGQGDLAGALEALRRGSAITQRLIERDPANADWQRDAALLHNAAGAVLTAQGDTPGALAEMGATVAAFERASAAAPGDLGRQHDLTVAQFAIGTVLLLNGSAADAAGHLRAGLAIAERLAARDPDNASLQDSLAGFRRLLGDALVAQGDTAGALALYDADGTDSERLAREHPDNPQWQHEVSLSQQYAGRALRIAGDTDGAVTRYRAALAAAESLAAKDPGNAEWRHNVVQAGQPIATLLLGRGDNAGALVQYESSLAVAESLVTSDPANMRWRLDAASTQIAVGKTLELLDRRGEAKPHLDKALALMREMQGPRAAEQ